VVEMMAHFTPVLQEAAEVVEVSTEEAALTASTPIAPVVVEEVAPDSEEEVEEDSEVDLSQLIQAEDLLDLQEEDSILHLKDLLLPQEPVAAVLQAVSVVAVALSIFKPKETYKML